jgi:dTDP-4-amino-4,6-dideoxygalactose transaminase
MIPFVDLYSQYINIKGEIDDAIKECISEGNFIKGKAVSDFETAFAKYLGVEYCLGCGNGTDALEIILKALNIGQGDEVIVPALTWIATAEAVNNVGAEPVFAEISSKTYTIDYRSLEEKITKRTKAIIPVHLYGCPADMKEILEIAGKYGLFVIEDCAQAIKNLGAFGDGGAIVTNNKALAEAVRINSNHGQLHEKHKHFNIGRNSRLDSIQASILRIKLKYLDEWNMKRQKAASYYISKLKGKNEFILPVSEEDRKNVFHLFVIRSKQRNRVTKLLDEKNISWGIHYPKPVPFLDAYYYKNHNVGDFAIAERITEEIISIPIYPEITTEQLNTICDQLLKL